MRFCRDCKHSEGEGAKQMKCNAPQNSVMSKDIAAYLVTGEAQPGVVAMRGANCKALRMKRTPEIDATICGPDGTWFEEKGK